MPNIFSVPVVLTMRAFAALVSLGLVLLGGSVLAGWFANLPALMTVRPGLAAMSPATALAFILAGLALGARRWGTAARTLAMLLLAFGVCVLLGYIFTGRDLLNPWLVRLLAAPGAPAGRTAPATACGFALVGGALLGLGRGRRGRRLVVACCGPGLLISGLALLGYAYGVEGLYEVGFYRTVAVHTAAGLFLLFLACLVSEPERGLAALVASGLPSGSATRVQLLLVTAVPFLVGLLALRGVRDGTVAPSLAMAILVASTMVPMVLRILQDGRMLDLLEMRRRVAVEAQRRLNQELEERVQARTASLATSEARLRTYFDHAPEGLVLFRMQGDTFVVEAASPSLRRMYALEATGLEGRAPHQVFDDAMADLLLVHLRTCLGSGEAVRYTARRVVAGQPRVFDVVLAPVPEVPAGPPAGQRAVIGSVRDVTDAHGLEEALRQSQKMEAVGQLTGGLAHDFNNLLTGVIGSLELLGDRLAQGRTGELGRYVTAAQDSAQRAAALTHRLLAFTRRQTLAPRLTDVNRLVGDMEELIRRTMGPAVQLEVSAGPQLWATLIDPNQLENALLNLCINARDAMPGGGRLSVATVNERLDAGIAAERGLPPGEYVALRVGDTGTGMTAEVARRAFDPFFTTKPLGSGTGLGLSMVYGFVQQSGGQVRIDSQPGGGTAVSLCFPRHEGVPAVAAAPPAAGAPPAARPGETVLVIDDEPAVRMLVTEVLEELGYAAIEAADGASGLQALRSSARIDLLISDVGLPGGMNGRQVADAARVVRPDLKVLFITGYAETAVLGQGGLEPGMHVLTKPFAMEALAGRIRTLIAG